MIPLMDVWMFWIDCVIGKLEMNSMMMCCNMVVINENYGVDDELGSYNHENLDFI